MDTSLDARLDINMLIPRRHGADHTQLGSCSKHEQYETKQNQMHYKSTIMCLHGGTSLNTKINEAVARPARSMWYDVTLTNALAQITTVTPHPTPHHNIALIHA